MPNSAPTVGTMKKIEKAFSNGDLSPAIVAIEANTDSAATKQAISELKSQAMASGQMHGPVVVEANPSHTVARVSIPLAGKGSDSVSNAALDTLRNKILPARSARYPARPTRSRADGAVRGRERVAEAEGADRVRLRPRLRVHPALVSFRSIVIAVKAIVLKPALRRCGVRRARRSVPVGLGRELPRLPVERRHRVVAADLMFVILFGLSMDYHVFILSRVREAYDRGLKTEDAVAHGISTTAGVVSSAALVMVGVFAVFALMPILDMKEMGIGLAAAVLIDATIVRAVLLPATMKLLGEANWYLPRWLEWLPRLEHEASPPEKAPAGAPAAALGA